MLNVDMSQFRPLKFDFGKIHMSGGQSIKSYPLTSRAVIGPDGKNMTFVKLVASEAWLLASTTGQCKFVGSSFGRTSLLDALRTEIQRHCDGAVSVPDPRPAGGDVYDPMAEVEEDNRDYTSGNKIKGRGEKRVRLYHRTKTVVTLDMPAHCPEVDPTGTERRMIKVYVEDRKQIWIALEDVEWAVRYLYIQNLLKGVSLIPDDSTGPVDAPSIHGHGDRMLEDTRTSGDTQ